MQRTSASHPLQIAEIRALEGVIGLTFCPEKKGDSVLGAPWDRDLDTDLQAIKAWGASKVITLMERHEFDLLSVRGLGEAIQRLGIDWVHGPVTLSCLCGCSLKRPFFPKPRGFPNRGLNVTGVCAPRFLLFGFLRGHRCS